MITALSLITFVFAAALLSVLWIGIAWSLVRLLKLRSPVARVFVFLAPLLASFVALLRLMPDARLDIVLVCLGAAIVFSAKDLVQYLHYRAGITARGTRHARAEALCQALAAAMGVVPAPKVYAADDLQAGPMVLGTFNPTIVFPAQIVGQLSDDEVRVLLAHELAHVHRRDMLLKWLLLFLRRLAFWNPVAAWPYRWLSLEIEFACDRIACRVTGKPGTLARTLCKIQQLRAMHTDVAVQPLEMIPRADVGLRARIEYLGMPGSYQFEWRNLFKTLLIFSVYWLVCSRPAAFLLPMIDQTQ